MNKESKIELSADEATKEMVNGLAIVVENLMNFAYNKEVSIEEFKNIIDEYKKIKEKCGQVIDVKPYNDEINTRLESFTDLDGIRV